MLDRYFDGLSVEPVVAGSGWALIDGFPALFPGLAGADEPRAEDDDPMERIERADAIRGKTIRMTWTEGPTKGTTHEHVFHPDGTVTWRDPSSSDQPGSDAKAGQSKTPEQPAYAAVEAGDGVYAVSYLASSGYTLTAVLNFGDQRIVGFASSAKDWHPVRGTFEVVP